MFLVSRMKKRVSRLWPVLLVAIVAGTLAFAACGGEDPTATPEPTATPAPTATPVPTPTPEPTATPEPEPVPSDVSITDIDENSTVGDLIGALSEEEIACITAAFGEVILESMKDQSLAAVAASFELFPIQCLSEENAISAAVTMMSVQAGGLSDDAMACLVDTYAEYGIPGPAMSEGDSMRSFLYAQLCLTDEEAHALQGDAPAEDPLPTPSQLRCVSEQTDLGNLIVFMSEFEKMMMSGEEPSEDFLMLMGELFAAYEACGLEPVSGDFVPMEP